MEKVPKNYSNTPLEINYDGFSMHTSKLSDYVGQLKCVSTKDIPSTWGRTYIEVPINVLGCFGITSNQPLVFYINYVESAPFFFAYHGEIFSGDAAWFSEYETITDSHKIISTETFKSLDSALKDKSKTFREHIDPIALKWEIVEVHDQEAALIAKDLNKHIK